jgi:hypothetical protein
MESEMKQAAWVAALAGAVAVSGCATILSDDTYPVTINSNPPGAQVTVKNRDGMEVHKGITPLTLVLPADNGFFSSGKYTLEFSKEGHLPSITNFNGELDPWYLGNILFGGLLGMLIVDPATGAMWKLDPTVIGSLQADPEFRVVEAAPPALAPVAPAAEVADDTAAQLRALKQLKDEGVITEAEYEAKRAPLVEQL